MSTGYNSNWLSLIAKWLQGLCVELVMLFPLTEFLRRFNQDAFLRSRYLICASLRVGRVL